MPPLNPLDLIGLAFFAGGWIVYAMVIEWSARGGLNARMDRYREIWMRHMFRREMRMVDMQIMASRQTGTAFFASTSLIAIGGAAPQVSPSTTAAIATMTMATVAVSTVTVVATQRISRSWPARKATARGIAAGMAGRVSTDIGQAPIVCRRRYAGGILARDAVSVTNQLARHQNTAADATLTNFLHTARAFSPQLVDETLIAGALAERR